MQRLDDQISWYDRKSMTAQRWYMWLKIVGMIAAAFIPLMAGRGVSVYVTGGLGVLVVILEGLQHLNQYYHNWITYRSTCESLKHEKYLYLAQAGPYAEASEPHQLLAERTEELISQEHAKWVTARKNAHEKPAERKGPTP